VREILSNRSVAASEAGPERLDLQLRLSLAWVDALTGGVIDAMSALRRARRASASACRGVVGLVLAFFRDLPHKKRMYDLGISR
jgi:hypothetical protein